MRGGAYDAQAAIGALTRACLASGHEPTSRRLAEMAGVNRRTIFRWKAGQRSFMGDAVADRIEAATGVHISHLSLQPCTS
jgi:hypothetical protein